MSKAVMQDYGIALCGLLYLLLLTSYCDVLVMLFWLMMVGANHSMALYILCLSFL